MSENISDVLLAQMAALGIKGERSVIPERVNTATKYHLLGGRVVEREGHHWFEFEGAAHGSPTIIKEISKQDYLMVREGKLDFSLLAQKYPELDGDAVRSKRMSERWLKMGIW